MAMRRRVDEFGRFLCTWRAVSAQAVWLRRQWSAAGFVGPEDRRGARRLRPLADVVSDAQLWRQAVGRRRKGKRQGRAT